MCVRRFEIDPYCVSVPTSSAQCTQPMHSTLHLPVDHIRSLTHYTCIYGPSIILSYLNMMRLYYIGPRLVASKRKIEAKHVRVHEQQHDALIAFYRAPPQNYVPKYVAKWENETLFIPSAALIRLCVGFIERMPIERSLLIRKSRNQ